MGSTWMASSIRDFPAGNTIGGSECNCVDEHDLHVHNRTSVFDDAVPYEIRIVLILCVFRCGDVDFRLRFLAGDERCTDRGDEPGLEIALVLVKVH